MRRTKQRRTQMAEGGGDMTLERVLIAVGSVCVGHVIGRVGVAVRERYGSVWAWACMAGMLALFAVCMRTPLCSTHYRRRKRA